MTVLVTPISAQIVLDQSLGREMSKITPTLTTDRIEGGALRGQNLFHSFQEFNVSNNRSVYFIDPGGIQNIISRVTGNSRSEILGTLGVLGNSNLFLLNPNGIVFGQDSKLDVKGAFVGTTGDSFLFDNNQTFSATNPQAPPLLLIKTPIGISFRDNQAQISTRSVNTRENAPFPLSNLVGLVANKINLIGGSLTITGGITANQINLAAVNQGTVGIKPDLSFSYDQALKFGEISIDRGQIDVSGNGAGTIDLRASNINLNDSQITAYTLGTIDGGAINLHTDNLNLNRSIISASTFGTGRSGDLTIQAKEAVTIRGESLTRFQQTLDRLFFQGLDVVDPNLPKVERPQDFGTGILALSFSPGHTGNLTIETPDLQMETSFISTLTFVSGQAGNLKVTAPQIVLKSAQFNAESLNDGNSGNIMLQTQNMLASGGSVVAASTFGRGRGGNVMIRGIEPGHPAQTLTFVGRIPDTPLYSGIFSNTFLSGDAGAVDIFARDIFLKEGASIASVGPVIPFFGINSRGNGGNITVRATNSITIDGDRGEIGARSANTGNAGKINITAKELNIVNNGFIDSSTVDNNGTGSAGNVQINVETLRLNNQGRITANTRSGTEGDITINADTIELRNNSRITSDGGTSNGGNITINSNILLAFPNQNNDITANARTAEGGKVRINAQGILGFTNFNRDEIQTRSGLSAAEFANLADNPTLLLPSSDIAAISQNQALIGGTVTFNTSGINPSQALVELPQTLIDPRAVAVSQACKVAEQNSFVIKGNGGLPENPQDLLHTTGAEYSWLPFVPSTTQSQNRSNTELLSPADGIVRDEQGQFHLISRHGHQSCRR